MSLTHTKTNKEVIDKEALIGYLSQEIYKANRLSSAPEYAGVEIALSNVKKLLESGKHDYSPNYPTEWAYEQACKALWKNRDIAEVAINALKFYAEDGTYDIDHLDQHGYIIIDADAGKTAKNALAEVKKMGFKSDPLWKVVIGYSDSGQTTLIKDGFTSEAEAYRFSKNVVCDALDEFVRVQMVYT